MTNCPVCQRDTSPVKIGGQLYCSVCGTIRLTETPAEAAPPRPVNLDLARRSRTNVLRPDAPPAPPAPPPAQLHHGTAAAALHQRTKTSRVLDLRNVDHTETPLPHRPTHITPAAPPRSTAQERHLARFTDRFERAKQISRSPHIDKFAGKRLPSPDPATHHQTVNEHMHATRHYEPAQAAGMPNLPAQAAANHAAMTRLIPHIPETPLPAPNASIHSPLQAPSFSGSSARNRTLATVTAVALMGGYIWLQNYPKLALQTASAKAGIKASLPGYLPSSYNLKNTNTGPGLVTLSFFSPSSSVPLTIAQSKTDWDSNSLLDNFIAKHTDDYATVQGQGLTIYLFNNNQAAWVNHGIKYAISGAEHLSREQILKIAYSL